MFTHPPITVSLMLFTSVEWFQAGDELAGISGGFASPNVALHAADNVIESHVGC